LNFEWVTRCPPRRWARTRWSCNAAHQSAGGDCGRKARLLQGPAPRHPFHHAFDGERGCITHFRPLRFKRAARELVNARHHHYVPTGRGTRAFGEALTGRCACPLPSRGKPWCASRRVAGRRLDVGPQRVNSVVRARSFWQLLDGSASKADTGRSSGAAGAASWSCLTNPGG
jgi:hypothetical protein